MCMMAAAIAGGVLQAAGSIAQFGAQSAATSAYNQRAAENARDASIAASNKYTAEGYKYIYDSRMNQQEAYNAAMKGRQATGTAIASAGSTGFDIGSLSVNSIIAGEEQKTAQNIENYKTKQEDLLTSRNYKVKSYEAEAQGRINSMPFRSGPDPLGLMINIASAGVGAYRQANS